MINRGDPLDQELQRSRRYARPLSLVRVRARAGDAAPLVAALEGMTREVDHLWTVGRDVVVLLPEADPAAAQAFVDRACDPLAGTLVWETATASFPDDGLTRQALVAALNGDHGERVEPPPVARRDEPLALPRARSGSGRGRTPVAAGFGRDRRAHDQEDDRPSRQAG
jgi:hypothetical protein